MSIFDIFTGDPAREAAERSRLHFDEVTRTGQTNIRNALDDAIAAVSSGKVGAQEQLAQALAAIQGGGTTALGALDRGQTDALGRLDQARTTLGQAGDAFRPLNDLAAKHGLSTTMFQNALGVNGPEAMTAARNTFTAAPGYQFNVDQGLEAINRRRNMGGMLSSGNADREAQVFGAGLASQGYDKWLSDLATSINPELSATTTAATGRAGVLRDQAGIDTTAANMINTGGMNRANLATDTAGRIAQLYGTRGGLEMDTGKTLAGLATNAGQQRLSLGMGLAQPYANTYGQEAQAQMAGSGNLWNLGMNVARLGTGLLGGGLPGFGGASASAAPAANPGFNPFGPSRIY